MAPKEWDSYSKKYIFYCIVRDPNSDRLGNVYLLVWLGNFVPVILWIPNTHPLTTIHNDHIKWLTTPCPSLEDREDTEASIEAREFRLCIYDTALALQPVLLLVHFKSSGRQFRIGSMRLKFKRYQNCSLNKFALSPWFDLLYGRNAILISEF